MENSDDRRLQSLSGLLCIEANPASSPPRSTLGDFQYQG
eukprot:CAMPEP_0179275340 /NCGR_PEP_ID=MMETSP0797-20121207/34010_1 /TAXON_ID=47934 /ORGANISM="Dinophysis acuminata, Strain DAEP01" /LENGTH=38 /DNA_ID= /DNA_START= /DNA_END= /DNA_ORIENTATION=